MSIRRIPIFRKVLNLSGDVVPGASVTVYSPPGGTALGTVYTTESGTSLYSQPLVTDSNGGIPGWVEIGDYDIKVENAGGTVTSRYNAVHPDQNVLESGSVSSPSVTFLTDSTTGIYSPGTSQIGIAVAGTEYMRFYSGSITVNESFIAKKAHIWDSGTVTLISLNQNDPAAGIPALLKLWNTGLVEWGDGVSGPLDTNLYRQTSNHLKTDDKLEVNTLNITSSGLDSLLLGNDSIALQVFLSQEVFD